MKGIKSILIAVICSMVFVGCGKVSTLQFYKACYTGDEKKVDEYLQYENFTIELNENESKAFVNFLEKVDTKRMFVRGEYEVTFLGNPIAVSVFGGNDSIVKKLSVFVEYDKEDEDNILYVVARMNNTEMGKYFFEECFFAPSTYNPFIQMIMKDNVELFKIYEGYIEDITEPVYKSGENLLMVAAKFNAINCVKYFVDSKKFDINAMNDGMGTALSFASNQEIKDYIKNANGECLSQLALDIIYELKRLKEICLDYCDKSKYSQAEVLDFILDMGSSGTMLSKLESLLRNVSSLTKWEMQQITKYTEEFYSAWEKVGSTRMYG